MALIKAFEWKGYTPGYWIIIDRIIDDNASTTLLRFGCYKNKVQRNIDKDISNKERGNMLPLLEKLVVIVGTSNTKTQCYTLAKTSDLREVIITPAVLNPTTGEIITPAVTEMQEFNFFVDAVED